MSDERERTVERAAVDEATRAADDEATRDLAPARSSAEDVDAAAESFLALESRFQGTGSDTVRGRAVNVETVPASEVPGDYPVRVDTPAALALELAVDAADGRRVVAYFAWDEGRTDDRLSRLLALHGIPAHRFGDLHGESILLRAEDGYYLPCVPEESARGSARGVYGVGLGLAVNLLSLGLLAGGFGSVLSSAVVLVAVFAVNLLLLPASTYLDGWYLRTQTDWGQGPAFWALLAALPGLNVASSLAYLYYRQRARPLAGE
ncbi:MULTISPECIES: hypothetical protein [Salinibaculum]|uniref:hypothetical protein n=1 Tax=Salinibaculum TaxID=2732368 RepID=UPI0030D330A7